MVVGLPAVLVDFQRLPMAHEIRKPMLENRHVSFRELLSLFFKSVHNIVIIFWA